MKILIAEDDAPVGKMLKGFLTGLGHSVQAVENGAELIKLALNETPDLIITDLHMPEMSGNSMISMIDLYSPLSGVPVIIITGISKGELAEAALPKGIPIITKPFDLDRMTEEINKITERGTRDARPSQHS